MDVDFSYDTSQPYRSETHGVIENAIQRVNQGTSCALSQSGLTTYWWAQAMAIFCFFRNTVDLFKLQSIPAGNKAITDIP